MLKMLTCSTRRIWFYPMCPKSKNLDSYYVPYVPNILVYLICPSCPTHAKIKKFWFVLHVPCDKTFGMFMRSILAKKWCSMRTISCKYQQKLTHHKYLTCNTCQKNWLAIAKQTKSNNLRGKERPEIVSVKCLSVMKWTIHKMLFTFISCEFK